MTQRDIRNDLLGQLGLKNIISTNTTTNGTIIDTQGFNGGIFFSLLTTLYTDGTYTPSIQEGNDAALADAAAVPADRLTGTLAGAALNSLTAGGAVLKTIGVLSGKRYIRLNIVSTGVTTGATVVATAHKKSDIMPALGLSA